MNKVKSTRKVFVGCVFERWFITFQPHKDLYERTILVRTLIFFNKGAYRIITLSLSCGDG